MRWCWLVSVCVCVCAWVCLCVCGWGVAPASQLAGRVDTSGWGFLVGGRGVYVLAHMVYAVFVSERTGVGGVDLR